MSTIQPASVAPGYAHDVFVSYAHLDDEAVPPDEGWVTMFLRRLGPKVQTRLGRRLSLWNDRQLGGHVEVTPEILNAVRGSAVLVVLMSPSYLNSEWCHRERTAFLDVVAERARSSRRLFMVHMLETDREACPETLRDRVGYQFWKKDSLSSTISTLDPVQDRESYHMVLDRLTYELAEELKLLARTDRTGSSIQGMPTARTSAEEPRGRSAETPATGRARGSQATVLLAEPTDDLQDQYDEVKQYLLRADLRIVPEEQYPLEALPFKEAVQRDLQASAIFVQILSSVVGRKPAGADKSRARLQWECAKAADKPILQWRVSESETRARDLEQREFLERPTVRSGSLEDFKRQIWEQVSAMVKRPAVSGAGPRAFLLLDADRGDEDLANRVSNLVAECDIDLAEPWRRATPDSMSASVIRDMRSCDALIIVYGSVDPDWVDNQLRLWHKYAWNRERPLELFAIYKGPGEPRPPLGVRLTNVEIMNLQDGSDEDRLRALLAALKQKRLAMSDAERAGPAHA